MGRWFDKIDKCWRALPIEKQHKYVLYFFVGYLFITAGVIFKVLYDIGKSDNDIVIEHIKNPVLKKKGSPSFLKDK
jgi:hypothetical protein